MAFFYKFKSTLKPPLMNRWIALTVLLFSCILFSCAEHTEEVDYTSLSDEERLEIATELAQNTIMVDGHVDLPYRMKVGGFTLQREMLDVSVRTEGGNFDFPRAKEGGLDAPFMSIYIPAAYQMRGDRKSVV